MKHMRWLSVALCMALRAEKYTVNFDESMHTNAYMHIVTHEKTKRLVGVNGPTLMDFFRRNYTQLNFASITPSLTPRIPKKIHQIWIGSGVPQELHAFQETFKALHPDWEYRLWTQNDIPHMHLYNRDLIDKATNPAEKADLLRYEILYQYGGVYADMDCECLQKLDPLNYLYDFYIGIQPLDSGLVQLGIGLIGSAPKHPLLHACIISLADNYKNKLIENNITAKTGPIHMTKIFFAMAGATGTRDVALPAHYFYPLGSTETVIKKNEWITRGSFVVHHWAKTWNKPCYRRPQFRSVQSWGNLL